MERVYKVCWVFSFIVWAFLAFVTKHGFLGVLLAAAGIALAVYFYVKGKEAKETAQRQEEIQRQQASDKAKKDFYLNCEKAGIVNISTSEARQKASLIARRDGLNTSNIDELFNEAAQLVKADREKEHREKLEALQKEEREKYNRLKRYANLSGRDKRIAMLSDEQAVPLKRLAELGALDGDMMKFAKSNMQREMSWGLHGGIASGIAGPAAGLAAAMDVQNKNAQIRAQNDAMLSAVAALSMKSIQQQGDCRRKVEEYEKLIEEAKVKLVSDIPKEELFEKLEIKLSKVEISDSGAFTVRASIKQKKEFRAFESVKENSTIDGTISAELYQEGKLVGSALLVLPINGIYATYTSSIDGICLDRAKKGVENEVKFTPYRLWAMEK